MVHGLRARLVAMYARVEADLDFIEENMQFLDRAAALTDLDEILAVLRGLVSSYQTGRFLQSGIAVGLFGRVNAGKSSLLNRLVGYDRAIVSDAPGTTRDTVEATMEHGGFLFRFTDTAGFRDNPDIVEADGIRRTHTALDTADLAMLVMDAAEGNFGADAPLYEMLRARMTNGAERSNRVIVVANKMDLVGQVPLWPFVSPAGPYVGVSALRGDGIESLKATLLDSLGTSLNTDREIHVGSIRQRRLMEEAHESLQRTRAGLATGQGGEFLALDFRMAIDRLGAITGEGLGDAVLDEIFSSFCIGK